MLCSNAMNKSHKCVYCKCDECYAKELRTEDGDNNVITNKSRKCINNEIHSRQRSKRYRKARNISQGQNTVK